MPLDQQLHIASTYKFSAVIAENYKPSLDASKEKYRLQLFSLDSYLWESEASIFIFIFMPHSTR